MDIRTRAFCCSNTECLTRKYCSDCWNVIASSLRALSEHDTQISRVPLHTSRRYHSAPVAMVGLRNVLYLTNVLVDREQFGWQHYFVWHISNSVKNVGIYQAAIKGGRKNTREGVIFGSKY